MSEIKVLISQNAPQVPGTYSSVEQEFGAKIDFVPFFLIQPLTSREFRGQRINISDYTAFVFSSRTAIDAFFSLCEELRVKIPETMKYFCSTEAVAKYLQKHIVYRKRKIFFGNGTPESILAEIGTKHAGEKFLITTSGSTSTDITRAFENTKLDWTPAIFTKPVPQDITNLKLEDYAVIALYSCNDVDSIYHNFPDFKQGNIKFISFGKSTAKAMEKAGLAIEIAAPTAEVPSVAKALEIYLKK